MQKIESCLEDTATWMSLNKHKLNSEKTELLGIIGSQNLSASQFPSFTSINGSVIQPSQFVGNIGVIFDNKLNMERQVAAICKSAFFRIRNISRIRKFLSVSCTKALVHAFVTCRLDMVMVSVIWFSEIFSSQTEIGSKVCSTAGLMWS